jgi:hypothetical protein
MIFSMLAGTVASWLQEREVSENYFPLLYVMGLAMVVGIIAALVIIFWLRKEDREITSDISEKPLQKVQSVATTTISFPASELRRKPEPARISLGTKTFVVQTDIPHSLSINVSDWMQRIPDLLSQKGVNDVKFKTAYCCTPDRKIIAIFEGPDEEAVTNALGKIQMPFTVIMEANYFTLSSL